MRQLIVICLISLTYISCFATQQIPDKIIYEGDTIYLGGLPLEQYFDYNARPNFVSLGSCFSTGCYRGYKALWEIKENKLVLNSLYSCCESTDILIRNKDTLILKKKLPQKVYAIITPYINKRIDSRKLYNILNDASENKSWVRKYGYLYINDIEDNCKQIIVQHELSTEKIFSKETELIAASWFTGNLSFDYGKDIKDTSYSYFTKSEYTVKLNIKDGVIVDKEIIKN